MIRLLSGILKNRVIELNEPIKGSITRPTLAIVRKSIFEMLGDLKGMRVLDLFAGTGVLGFESLSHGAEEIYFIDKEQRNVKNIEMNLKRFSMSDKAQTYNADYRMAIKALSKREIKFDVIISDPPYKWSTKFNTLEYIEKYDILKNNGKIIYLHSKNESINHSGWVILQKKIFSATEILVMQREGEIV